MYVGQSKRPKSRWTAHKSEARRNSPHPLHSAIRKYGVENFAFDILLEVDTPEQADYQERAWILLLGAHKSQHGYVVSRDGKGNAGLLPEDLNRRGKAVSKAFSDRQGPHHSRKDYITPCKVLALYEQGKLPKDIANLLGCSAGTVSKRLREAGKPSKRGQRPNGYVYPSTPRRDLDDEKLRTMYSQGYSTTRISRELNCSTGLVRTRLLESGVTPRTFKESLEIRKSLPPVTWNRSEESNQKTSVAITRAWREGRHVGNSKGAQTY